MDKRIFFLISVISVISYSCSNEYLENIDSSIGTAQLQDSLYLDDIIVSIEGNRDTLPKPQMFKSLSYEDEYEIKQLQDVPIYIKVKGNSSDKQFLTVYTRGSEVKAASYGGNTGQQFYIQVPPSVMGIPYLIYSKNTSTPLSVGVYSSKPNEKILYARQETEGSSFGCSWDISKGNYSSGSFVIQSMDSPISTEEWWNVYYPAITVNDSKISFNKYNNNPRQEFEFVPVETFVIEQIIFNVDAASILSKQPINIFKEGYSNDGPIEQNYTFAVNKTYTQTSNYNRKTSYNVNTSTEIKAKVPFIASGKVTTSISFGQEYTYGKSESTQIAVNRTYPVKVPANYRADLSIVFFKYNLDVDYIAICRGLTSGRKLEIKGVWSGVDVEETDASAIFTPLSGGVSKTVQITEQMLKSKEIVKIQ